MDNEDNSPIVFYQYFDTTSTDYFQRRVRERFRETGHRREIDFRIWDCYDEPPGRDGDIFSYDCIVLNALCDKGYLRQLPEIVDTEGVFQWMLDTTKIKRKLYALPFITCFNAIICRRRDYTGIDNIFDIKGQLVAPLRSMISTYYLMSFCSYQDRPMSRLNESDFDSNAVRVMSLLAELMGGREAVERSAFSTFDGIERFNSGEVKYFLGFTENLRLMDRDDYVVVPANFSDQKEISIPLFSTDVLSIGANVREDKLLDCIDLIEIITDADFEYDLCAPEGELHYMLPANERVYHRLMEKDSIYRQLLDIVANDENCVFRFAKSYYEKLPGMERALLAALGGNAK